MPSTGRKIEVATSPLPSRGSKRGRNRYVTPAFSGVPNAMCGEKNGIGYLTPALSETRTRVESLCNRCISRGPQRQVWGENQIWVPHPCLLGGPKEGGVATQPLHSRGSPTPSAGRKSEMPTSRLRSRGPKRGRNCYVTAAFSGVPNTK